MFNDYINNFEEIASSILFVGFKFLLIILVIMLILSLIMLAIGCLIKSQKIRAKFLIIVPSLLLGIILFLVLPYMLVYFKNIK